MKMLMHKTVNLYRSKYRFALSALACLAIFFFLTAQSLLQSQEKYGSLINVMGRQRMLSQRIMLKLTTLHVTNKEIIIEDVRRELNDSLELFEQSHKNIIEGTFQNGRQYEISEKLIKFYSQSGLDRDISRYISLVRQSLLQNEISPELTRQFRENLLSKLDQAVLIVEQESAQSVMKFSLIEVGVLFLTLLILLLQMRLIFMPLERTLHNVIDDLIHAKDKAIEAGLAKSQFLAMVGHEIRTPLNGILGTTQLLLEEKVEPVIREHLDVIKASGEHLKALIHDTLELVKMESGKMSIESEAFDLKQALTSTIYLFETNAKVKGLELLYLDKGLGDLEWVLGDVTRVKQILANLLSNAVKFTPNGTVTIIPSYQTLDDGGYLVTVQVRDTGVGIPDARKERLFEIFEQGESTNTREFGGSGLGLTISRALARGMGGDVWAKNNPDRGATFSFSFKVLKANKPERDESFSVKQSDPNFAKNHPLSILVVDDNQINRRLGVNFLSKLGYQASMAAGGLEAVELQREYHFDVIFMDCQMPTYDGFYATRLIRSERELSEGCWIIACTASPNEQYKQMSFDSGMNDFIAKPISFEAIKSSLIKAYENLNSESSKS